MQDAKTARALQAVARALGRLGRERARTVDMTPQQAEAVHLVFERGAMSTSTLASMLGIDPSTASRNLVGLERGGYIVRRRDAEDARQNDVRLTARGKRTAESLSAEWAQLSTVVMERIPRAERQAIVDALDILARVLDGESPER